MAGFSNVKKKMWYISNETTLHKRLTDTEINNYRIR